LKLSSLTLSNFIQYYGGEKEQTIIFSKSEDKRVTVIHGENGSGKTALLNSFLWLFYGRVNLPTQTKIVNERAIAEAEVGDNIEIKVQLSFEHEDKKYTVCRIQIVKKESDDDFTGSKIKEDLHLQFIDITGKTQTPGNPQEIIEQIMPPRLNQLFFFHGEYIDRLSKTESSEEIKNAIKNIMGLTILEKSVKHLSEVGRRFGSEMEKYGDKELKEIHQIQSGKEKEIADIKNDLKNLKENLNALQKCKEEVIRKLKALEGAREKQERRERLEKELENNQELLKKIKKEMKLLCSDKTYLAFATRPFKEANEVIGDKRKKGEIPSNIKKQFVNDLLEAHKCICGRPLEEGTEPYKIVTQWQEKAGPEGLDEAVTLLTSSINDFPRMREEFISKLKMSLKERDNLSEKIRNLKEQISEIGHDFQKDTEDVKELENKRNAIDGKIENTKVEINIKKGKIQTFEKELMELEKKEEKAKMKDAKGKLAQKRFIVCQRAKRGVENLFKDLAEKVRKRTQSKIGDLYANFINKPYWAEITDDYELKVFKNVGEQKVPVSMSTGERQIASLSFIGGLVDICRQQDEKKKDTQYFRGGIYPIIMDSPFGYLDKDYRKNVCEGMPNLAKQVIVLVTSTQWEGIVEEVLKTKAGAEYNLDYYNPKTMTDVKYEYTLIKKV